MTTLALEVLGWLAPGDGDEATRATSGSLRITAGAGTPVSITEVEDRIAATVRSHVNVSMVALAEWLLMNWWRLRWESPSTHTTADWRRAHCLAAIGGGD